MASLNKPELDPMGVVHLDEFIEKSRPSSWPRSAWVQFEGFDSLYVRVGPRYIPEHNYPLVIDLANLTATEPGKGSFKKLIQHIQKHWPEYGIHVENALTEKFRLGLVRMGFIPTQTPMCFYIPPKNQDNDKANQT